MPVAGAGFVCAFVFAVFAWLMQLSTFWLPVLTGDVRYGHGICIKLDTQHNQTQKQPNSVLAFLHAKSPSKTAYTPDEHSQSNSPKHSGHEDHHAHASHHAHHDMHAQHMMHDMSAHSEHSSARHAESHTSHHNHHEHHMMSASAHDNDNTLISTIKGNTADNELDHSNSNHCDICMLLASVSSLDVFDDFSFNVIREAQAIATHWLYRQRLETTFDYILPPSRAPPVFS